MGSVDSEVLLVLIAAVVVKYKNSYSMRSESNRQSILKMLEAYKEIAKVERITKWRRGVRRRAKRRLRHKLRFRSDILERRKDSETESDETEVSSASETMTTSEEEEEED